MDSNIVEFVVRGRFFAHLINSHCFLSWPRSSEYHCRSGHPRAGSGGVVRARDRPPGGAGVGHERQDHDQPFAARRVAHVRRVAHNATGSNMADGAVAALAAARDAEYAVLEVDEWHLAAVARAVQPAVVVLLLNLTRDQLDRGTEVRAGGALCSSCRGGPRACD